MTSTYAAFSSPTDTMIMFSGTQESTLSRKMWGFVYALLSLAGLAVLVPATRPGIFNEPTAYGFTIVLGILAFFCYGISSFAAFFPKDRLYWLENTMSWFGNMGLGIYMFTIVSEFISGDPNRVPGMFIIGALLLIVVSRSVTIQRYLTQHNRLRELVRIAIRNETA